MEPVTADVMPLKPTCVWKLEKLALLSVSDLLINGTWNNEEWFLDPNSTESSSWNPLNLPMECIQSLMHFLNIRYYPLIPPEKTLRPLLMSNIRELHFMYKKHYLTNWHHLSDIFDLLSAYGRNIVSIKLIGCSADEDYEMCNECDPGFGDERYYFPSDSDESDPENAFMRVISSIEKLPVYKHEVILWDSFTKFLHFTPNLEILETGILFDTRVLCHNSKLRIIDLESLDEYNYMLISKYKNERIWGLLDLLQNLPELTHINGPVIKTLRAFHIKDPCNQVISDGKYKLKSIDLIAYFLLKAFELVDHVCPDVKEVIIDVCQDDIDNCVQLEVVKEMMKKYSFCLTVSSEMNYTRLFQVFNQNQITSLTFYFCNLPKNDFLDVCASLPNLQGLYIDSYKIKDEWAKIHNTETRVKQAKQILNNLKNIRIGNIQDYKHSASACKAFVHFILINSFQVEELQLSSNFVDSKMLLEYFYFSEISFPNLKEAHIECVASLKSIKTLVEKAENLKYLMFYCSKLNKKKILTIQSMNPSILIDAYDKSRYFK